MSSVREFVRFGNPGFELVAVGGERLELVHRGVALERMENLQDLILGDIGGGHLGQQIVHLLHEIDESVAVSGRHANDAQQFARLSFELLLGELRGDVANDHEQGLVVLAIDAAKVESVGSIAAHDLLGHLSDHDFERHEVGLDVFEGQRHLFLLGRVERKEPPSRRVPGPGTSPGRSGSGCPVGCRRC